MRGALRALLTLFAALSLLKGTAGQEVEAEAHVAANECINPSSLEALEARIAMLRDDLDVVSREREAQAKAAATLKAQYDNILLQNQALSERVNLDKGEAARVTAELNNLIAEKDALAAQLEATRDSLDRAVEAATGDATKEKEVREQLDKCRVAEAGFAACVSDQTALRKEFEHCSVQLHEEQTRVKDVHRQAQDAEQAAEIARSQAAQLKGELAEIHTRGAELETSLAEALKKQNELKSSLRAAKEQIHASERQLQALAQDEYIFTYSQYQKLRRKFNRLVAVTGASFRRVLFAWMSPQQVATLRNKFEKTVAESQSAAATQLERFRSSAAPATEIVVRQSSKIAAFYDKHAASAANVVRKETVRYYRKLTVISSKLTEKTKTLAETLIMERLYDSDPEWREIIPNNWRDRGFLLLFVSAVTYIGYSICRFILCSTIAPLLFSKRRIRPDHKKRRAPADSSMDKCAKKMREGDLSGAFAATSKKDTARASANESGDKITTSARSRKRNK